MNYIHHTAGLLLLAVISTASTGAAQDATAARKLAAKPIVVIRSGRLNARGMRDYLIELNQELNIGERLLEAFKTEEAELAISKHPNPVTGQMVFMVQGLVPGVESIQFSQVLDEADFERLVRAGTRSQEAGNVSLEGAKGKYRKTIKTSWREDITDAAEDSETESTQVTIGFGTKGAAVEVRDLDDEGEIIEEGGRRFRERKFTVTQYMRYHDGFMFTSSYEDLFNTELPSAEALIGAAAEGMDGEVDFYVDRIPVGFKHLFWSTIGGAASAGLQQRDEEDPIDYALRRSAGDIGLEAIHTMIFDVEHLSGRLTLADTNQPLLGELRLQARNNSNFSKRLDDYTSGRSRFAPILSDDAAFTFHTCVHFPEETEKVINAAAVWLKNRIIEASQGNVDVAIAGSEFGESMESLATRRDLELLMKVGWNASAGAVVYGGLQVDDNPEMLKSLFDLLTSPQLPPDFIDRIAMSKLGEHSMIVLRLPDSKPASPIHLTHLYITHVNSSLWFAAGGETSHEILRQSIEKCGGSSLRTKTPLLTGKLDLQKWTAWPQDEPTGLASLPMWLDGQFGRALSNSARASVNGQTVPAASTSDQPSPDLMKRVIDLGGSQDAELYVDADSSGIQMSGKLGAATARYFAARWLMTMEALVSNVTLPGESPTVEAVTE
ncbi:MAG: hypothetical protein KDA91_01715 [Planctomycetaceae bacterium]|nr:hypothetical protein [Planctomycetaceae bacterium]